MLRRDGEVFRFGTAMAEDSNQSAALWAPRNHLPAIRGAKQAGWLAGKPARFQAKNQGKPAKIRPP
jgi:hypothetical protein